MAERITGLVLAGGQGSRLGGRDKGLILLGDESLGARVVKRFAPQVDQLLLNANRNEAAYAALGHPVIGDLRHDFPGPLAGIAAGFARATHALLAVVPCDSPFLPTDLVSRLQEALQREDAEIAVARAGGELQPVFALLRTRLHHSLSTFMAGENRRLAQWYRAQRLAVVDFAHTSAFANLNLEADFVAAAQRLERERFARVLGIAGYSGSGKTTLLTQLLPALRARGLRVGVIKHAHHQFELDRPGKDSYELRQAGAARVLVASSRRWALLAEREEGGDPPLRELLTRIAAPDLDLILVEGFRHEQFPKLEVHRPALGRELLCVDDHSILAVATDGPVTLPRDLPRFDLNDGARIAEFIWQRQRAQTLEQPS
ncbi:MAG: molybdenum cofactor guanylyltransferase [Gammaproteobacteria bacterium]|nr:molybdenum cofactor guanylyltransferase [Gammaproteobacteria bacterium]